MELHINYLILFGFFVFFEKVLVLVYLGYILIVFCSFTFPFLSSSYSSFLPLVVDVLSGMSIYLCLSYIRVASITYVSTSMYLFTLYDISIWS